MQEVSSAVQTQAQKGVVLRQTAMQATTDTVVVIQISIIDNMMFSDQWLTIMRLNALFQAQAQRQMQTTTAVQILTIAIDQITPPYQTKMKSNIFFQGQAKRVTKKKKNKIKTSTEITKQL